MFAAILAAAACQTKQLPGTRCDVDEDCAVTESCIGGVCVEQPRACGASLPPCRDGQNCCGGYCTTALCCIADFECPGGYCADSTCHTGSRSGCSATEPCVFGKCLLASQSCVECISSQDCRSPVLVCSPAHSCVPSGSGCTAASCGQTGQICGVDGTCRPCVSSAECGDRVCESGRCERCTTPAACGIGRTCVSGSCVLDPASECTSNADCGNLWCNPATDRCDHCLLPSECGPGRYCQAADGTCHADSPECQDDSGCSPPETICLAGLCSPGCTATSCGLGQVCSPTTGRCQVISTGTLPLGATCATHDECASGICWPVLDESQQLVLLCSRACMRHDDCPTGFVCYELGDGNFCLDHDRLPGMALDVPPGGACSDTFANPDCMTGWCDTGAGACMEMCGRDADCDDVAGDALCVMRWPVGVDVDENGFLDITELTGFTALCYDGGWGILAAGAECPVSFDGWPSHDACLSGYCAQTPDYSQAPRCAEPCCTPHDCDPSRNVCKPLHVFDGIRETTTEPYAYQKLCLWREYLGTKVVGETCGSDAECTTEICAAGVSGVKRCTHTCCTDRDCADYDWAQSCRPPFTGGSAVDDANYEEIAGSLGRQAYTGVGSYLAKAFAPLCLPR